MRKITTLVSLLLLNYLLKAQINPPIRSGIPTPSIPGIAIPFFDARHAAMGNAGLATSIDYSDVFFNPAKTAFAKTRYGFYSSYNNWLNGLESDMYLIKVGINYKLPKNNSAISMNFTHFNQGLFQATSTTGASLGNYNSFDWMLGANYAKKLSPKLSLGVGLKYINSSLLAGLTIGSIQMKPVKAFAADISIFHEGTDSTKLINLNYGVYISNLSGQISYGGTESNFIPTNIGIGISPSINITKRIFYRLSIDANKLMIPTPKYNSTGTLIQPKTAIEGILGSFSDAPGGLEEEFQEIVWSIGGEFWFDEKFAVRGGKFLESSNKGGRNFTTFGIGAKIIKKVNVDLAYLFNHNDNSPVGNLWRANVTFGLGK